MRKNRETTMSRPRLLAAISAIFLLVVAGQTPVYAAGEKNAPVLAFDGRVIKATDVTPGGQVVFFAVGLVSNGFRSTVMRWSQVVSDDDHDGAVTFDAGQTIPCRSIWAVAEIANGHFAIAAPPGCPLRQAGALSARAFRHRTNGNLDGFLHERPYLDLLYVHPGKGAWTVRAADGSPTDADSKSDGVTTVTLAGARSLLSNGTPPASFVPGGILVAIDFYGFDVVAERLDAKLFSEVQP